MAQGSIGSIEEHNQQIQALTPTEESLADIPDDSPLPVTTFMSLSIFIFFFVVVFLGFLPLVVERFRDFKKFQMALLVAFVAGAIPLTMALVLHQSGVLTRASEVERPENIMIFDVTSESFRVSWQTQEEQYGAVRYGTEPVSETLDKTTLEIGGLKNSRDHEVMVTGLDHDTTYFFEILSGAHWFDRQGTPLAVTTL